MTKVLILVLLALPYLCLAQPFYNIKDYGAVANSDKLSTLAIQEAINTCYSDGGGTVLIPPGKFLSGSIELKENVSVHFSSGSTLEASPEIADYPGERKKFIHGLRANNISITGKGIIDGNGRSFWYEDGSYDERPTPFILFDSSQNVTIRDIKIINSPSHTLRIEDSQDFMIEGITVDNPFKGPNTDAIDIEDSKNVTITGCFLRSGDDLICLKSHDAPVENVVVTNCILESDDAAIKFGTGGDMAVRYCTFDNIIIRNTRYGISYFMLTGGNYEHNRFSNITIETGGRHKHQYPIFMDIDKRTPKHEYGKIENNILEDIKIITSGKILISGHSEQPIEGLTLRNIDLTIKDPADFSKAKKPRGNRFYPGLTTSKDLSRENAHIVLSEIQGLKLENVVINGETSSREAFHKSSVVND